MEDLEARVAALEASRADYGAVLAAVNALGANQREHSLRLREHSLRLVTVESKLDTVESRLVTVESRLGTVESRLGTVETEVADFRLETRDRFRSVDESLVEIKDLIIGRREN